jgi:hypothetical protein
VRAAGEVFALAVGDRSVAIANDTKARQVRRWPVAAEEVVASGGGRGDCRGGSTSGSACIFGSFATASAYLF